MWWLYESSDSRPQIIDAIRRFPEFFRFDSHAQLLSAVSHLAMLFESRSDTINFEALINDARTNNLIDQDNLTVAEGKLRSIAPLRSKVAILRSNVFSHRSGSLSYDDVFEKAVITPFELRDLTDISLQISDILSQARGLPECFYLPSSPDSLRRLLVEIAANGS